MPEPNCRFNRRDYCSEYKELCRFPNSLEECGGYMGVPIRVIQEWKSVGQGKTPMSNMRIRMPIRQWGGHL